MQTNAAFSALSVCCFGRSIVSFVFKIQSFKKRQGKGRKPSTYKNNESKYLNRVPDFLKKGNTNVHLRDIVPIWPTIWFQSAALRH